MQSPPPSLSAKLAVFAFGMLSLVGGWIVALGGGFNHAPVKYSSEVVFVSGAPAVMMATLQFLAAALAFTWLFRPRYGSGLAALGAFAFVFLPPMGYLKTM